jgi:hypothetical protein
VNGKVSTCVVSFIQTAGTRASLDEGFLLLFADPSLNLYQNILENYKTNR